MRISGDVLALGAVGLLVAGGAIRQRRQGSSARASTKQEALDKLRQYEEQISKRFAEGRTVYPEVTQAVLARAALKAGATEREVADVFGVTVAELRNFLGRQGSSARARRQGRAEKAARRLGEVIGRGTIVHLRGAHYTGTVGPHKTATGSQRFALFVDGRRGRSEGGPWEYDSALHAAEHAVEKFGVSNVIDGLKAAAKRHGGQYTNLDTPIFRGGSRSATGQRLIKKLGNVKVYYRPDLDEYAVVPGDQKPWGSRDSKVYYTPDKDDAIETAVKIYDRR